MQGEVEPKGPKPDFGTVKNEVTNKLEEGKRTATQTLDNARDEITRKAGDYASEAKEALFQQAEGTQRDISANLTAFEGALRAASEHLASNDQQTASRFVQDAAGGLARLSTSLKNKPFEEVLGEIRSFGRDNSGALIAGSVLAGLALGRFIKSSQPVGGSAETMSGQGGLGGRDGEDVAQRRQWAGTEGGANPSLSDELDDDWSRDEWNDASAEPNP